MEFRIGHMANSWHEFREYIEKNGSKACKRRIKIAGRTPIGLRNSNLRNRKTWRGNAPLKAPSIAVTLNQDTAEWLSQRPKGTKSATVEIALNRFLLWGPLLRMLDDCLELINEQDQEIEKLREKVKE